MNSFLFDAVSEALAFALLHSFWQGLFALLIAKALLKFISPQKSQVRYAIAGVSLMLLFISVAATFIIYFDPTAPLSAGNVTKYQGAFISAARTSGDSLVKATSWLDAIALYKEWIFLFWICGFVLGIVRLIGGYSYLIWLRRKVIPLHDWTDHLQELANNIGLRSKVLLAESTKITAPLVIGIIKPCIIFPAGLISGLSTDQVDSILMHELVHIRRHDFLLNLIQAFIEAALYFNPFVWVLSSMIRLEREHCCDDAVVKSGADTKTYVYALAALEQARANNVFALSLIGHKNQILERIKRLMEKSVRTNSLREKVIPVLFLFVGLVCASWFSIQTGPDHTPTFSSTRTVQADTVIKKTPKSATYSRKKTTVIAADGTPNETVVEEFNGDEDLRPWMEELAFEPVLPQGFPDVPSMAAFAPLPPDMFRVDSIPPAPGFHGQWNAFEEEFVKKFQERFGDFYEKNHSEIEKMMEEFASKFEREADWMHELSTDMENRHRHFERHAIAMADRAAAMELHGQNMKEFEEKMKEFELAHAEKLKALEKKMKVFEEKMKSFQETLRKELVKDGYLRSNESIKSMLWNDEGEMTVNGINIRSNDVKKYRKLHKEFFGEEARNLHFSE